MSTRTLYLLFVIAALALLSAPQVFAFGVGMPTLGKLGASSSQGSNGVGPSCTPGAPTGQMDFSICSNIAITAALW